MVSALQANSKGALALQPVTTSSDPVIRTVARELTIWEALEFALLVTSVDACARAPARRRLLVAATVHVELSTLLEVEQDDV